MFQIDAQVVLEVYLVFGFDIAIWPQDWINWNIVRINLIYWQNLVKKKKIKFKMRKLSDFGGLQLL